MKVLNFNALSIPMHIITDTEYDRLMDVTLGADILSHWYEMLSWVNDTENREDADLAARRARGCDSARAWSNSTASLRRAVLGFRPACTLAADALPSGIKNGEAVILGTLYMDGKPVRVPQRPTANGDISAYIDGAKLEMRLALEDPAYQVKGFFLGDGIFAADRNLLMLVSYADLARQGLERIPAISA